MYQTRPLPSVLVLHTGGTLGMSTKALESRDDLDGAAVFKSGTGGDYAKTLQPGKLLLNLITVVPELRTFANLEVKVLMNKDSCQIGPREWIEMARNSTRNNFPGDAFIVVHGTDTMAYTASALADAGWVSKTHHSDRVATAAGHAAVGRATESDRFGDVRHGGIFAAARAARGRWRCVRGNCSARTERGRRARRYTARSVRRSTRRWRSSASGWERDALAVWAGGSALSSYTPRLKLNPNVLRVPIVPGCDPTKAYGNLYDRGVRGIVLEAFGVGNMPGSGIETEGWIRGCVRSANAGWWCISPVSASRGGPAPGTLRHGIPLAMEMGAEAGPMMTPECAVVKLMLCLAYPNLPPSPFLSRMVVVTFESRRTNFEVRPRLSRVNKHPPARARARLSHG